MGHDSIVTYHPRTLRENLSSVVNNYPLNDHGYFGHRGQSGKSWIRIIDCQDPVAEAIGFYQGISRGGIERPLANGHGIQAELSDGTVVLLRITTSSPGSPAVHIDIRRSNDPYGIRQQKIHFVRSS